jgi:hypothetical protein
VERDNLHAHICNRQAPAKRSPPCLRQLAFFDSPLKANSL